MKNTSISILLFAFVWINVNAQERPVIVTDRPTQSISADVVPLRAFQMEAGILFGSYETDSIKVTYLAAPSILLRYGLLEYLELRLGFNYLNSRNQYKDKGFDEQYDGLSPLSAGFKVFISEQKKVLPRLSFTGSLIFPGTASNPYDIEHLAASMRLAGFWEVTRILTVGTNLGIEWDGFVPEGIWFYSVMAAATIYEGWGGFAEFYGYLPEREFPVHQFNTGFTYLIRNNLQADLSGGFSISRGAPDYFISGGISWRLPN